MTKSQSDIQLIKNVLNGDTSSFDILVGRYTKSVKYMLEKRNVSQVDDVLQDAFIKAYLNLSKYDEKYPFGGWVMTIAKNLSIDCKRKVSSSADVSFPLESLNLPSLYPDPEQLVVREQQSERLERIINNLSKNYRVILKLRFDEDMSYDEISKKLNIPIGTVKTQIHRARQALMTLMEKY